ncbi:MBOAT family O-acyltransferase [Entomospira culicis]|nr:MBOAT family O-acyltransferase [Entomospira culicis]WDI37599.1 MBOAT family protein [Entomospira culicis]WDI39227.1 MBOAT family protein [Entomospira culicis]
MNRVTSNALPLLNLMLPLAISFFTFQQIAFLVDSYKGNVRHTNFLDYTLFITFFPQLIAGPIVSHSEMTPQFLDANNRKISSVNTARGIFIFSLGLFKKVIIADTFALWANAGFGDVNLDFFSAWQTSLSYTFQLYFDFSGYSDMAIGLALLFNIHLPINFNSPYKALNIQDFWRRWHMTLSRFLSTYVYIPLGGNRQGKYRTYVNLTITFLLGGIWHGAGWTFIIWGLLHGLALVMHRMWRQWNIRMPNIIAWLLTFGFINGAWVFFRANNVREAMTLFKGMLGLNGFGNMQSNIETLIDFILSNSFSINTSLTIPIITIYIFSALLIILKMKNSQEQLIQFTTNYRTLFLASMSFLIAFLALLSDNNVSDFLYFNF